MKNALNKDDKIRAIKNGVAEAFGFDNFLQTNIWASPTTRSQILQAIKDGVSEAFTDFLKNRGE